VAPGLSAGADAPVRRRVLLVCVSLVLASCLVVAPVAIAAPTAVATFAGGCFWCMEAPFDVLDGVLQTTVGYTGGSEPDPSYEQVAAGSTGHAEAVRIEYDPARIDYARLLEVYWRNVDPTRADRQFCDVGRQYRPAIFYHDAKQRDAAERSRTDIARGARFDAPIVVEIVAAGPFYPAEDYHQDFYRKNALRYRFYRLNCGRDQRLRELWGTPH
jgi:peptide-methionine (S)-S-oxide reductase